MLVPVNDSKNKNNKLLAAIITIITLLLLGFLITNVNSEPDIIIDKNGHVKKINSNKIKCEEEKLLGIINTGRINCYIKGGD